jgi:hypothetical protein
MYLVSGLTSQYMLSAMDLGTEFSPLWISLCYVVVGPIIAVIGLAISAGIYHWIAQRFGGTGDWNRLVFCLACIQAPISLISTLIGGLAAPFYPSFIRDSSFSSGTGLPTFSPLICLFALVGIGISIYSIVLYIIAIRAVENIDTGKAILTFFSPVIVIFVLGFACTCVLTLLTAGQGLGYQ